MESNSTFPLVVIPCFQHGSQYKKKKKKKLPLKHISAVLSKKQNKNTQANNNNKERNRNRDKMKNAKSHKQVINLQNTPLAFSSSHGGTAISRREKE